jgi:transposase
VKALLEKGVREETIEKETSVSDRTIRRWKLELERTGRIGKVSCTPENL